MQPGNVGYTGGSAGGPLSNGDAAVVAGGVPLQGMKDGKEVGGATGGGFPAQLGVGVGGVVGVSVGSQAVEQQTVREREKQRKRNF